MEQERLHALISKLWQDRLIPDEQAELDELLLADPEGAALRPVLENMMRNTAPAKDFDERYWADVAQRQTADNPAPDCH